LIQLIWIKKEYKKSKNLSTNVDNPFYQMFINICIRDLRNQKKQRKKWSNTPWENRSNISQIKWRKMTLVLFHSLILTDCRVWVFISQSTVKTQKYRFPLSIYIFNKEKIPSKKQWILLSWRKCLVCKDFIKIIKNS
jgi:hypothetical protein